MRAPSDLKIYAALARSRAVFYTPTVGSTLRELREELPRLLTRVEACIEAHLPAAPDLVAPPRARPVELVLIDEAERLSTTALEYLRDLFDRHGLGLILIGMPGMEKRFSRSPQLYSRVGFAHHYRPLQDEELAFVLTRRWREPGLGLDEADFTDAQAVAAIVRITGGNFRLLHRLFVQIGRILRINGLHAITEEVVQAARTTLVIGDTYRWRSRTFIAGGHRRGTAQPREMSSNGLYQTGSHALGPFSEHFSVSTLACKPCFRCVRFEIILDIRV